MQSGAQPGSDDMGAAWSEADVWAVQVPCPHLEVMVLELALWVRQAQQGLASNRKDSAAHRDRYEVVFSGKLVREHVKLHWKHGLLIWKHIVLTPVRCGSIPCVCWFSLWLFAARLNPRNTTLPICDQPFTRGPPLFWFNPHPRTPSPLSPPTT